MKEVMDIPVKIDNSAHDWAASMLSSLSLKEKIGQLIHMAAWSNRGAAHDEQLLKTIQEYGVGGVIFFQGDPERQAVLTNACQEVSKVPVMISIDGEWGLGMRLDGVEAFPYQMTLGAVADPSLIEEMGRLVGRQMRRLGVNLNHAPVIDVNTNPANPVINFRSFGQQVEAVQERATAYMKGMQSEQVLACAKHFPGHGDTAVDSHLALPVLDKSLAELKATELQPFAHLFREGVGAVMTGHLQVTVLQNDKRASSLAKEIVHTLLQEQMGFKGLVVTDALDMKAVADHFPPGGAEVEAFLAGNDVLLFVRDVAVTVEAMLQAVKDGRIAEESIDKRVYKQLLFKYWMGLSSYESVDLENIVEEVNTGISELNEKLFAASITCPKRELADGQALEALFSFFGEGEQVEQGALAHHTTTKGSERSQKMPVFDAGWMAAYPQCQRFECRFAGSSAPFTMPEIKEGAEVMLAIHDVRLKAPGNFGLNDQLLNAVRALVSKYRVHLVFFGNAYALGSLPELEQCASIMLAYQENHYTQKYMLEALQGHISMHGRLPVDVASWSAGSGLSINH
ncbi:glycoside hydrolase family 3 protein [Marinoscillum furvescens]|uniref:beta-N-acetylhexosaminidase n=1 Tax=Marinoscillum furvescens DSM 4134 TaxID=1122208 RepID=A0A3D9L784_MARFU|nr:glycoside hydrolase family 3 N-terminal domain-containing protein [Marinoscillum furvescens]REE01160.1 beta-glucosidase-like glycosyl hydrolase [Marinoscillum furvescens DSM 4134]